MKREGISITESSCNFNIARALTDLFDDDDVHKKSCSIIPFFCNISLFLFAGANFKFHRRKFDFKDPLINSIDLFWIILK